MSLDRSYYWIVIAVIAALIAAIWAWFFYRDLAPLFMFLAGACFTMWAQERLEKKRRKRNFDIKMTEHVYGPMHKELSWILAIVKEFQAPRVSETLDTIIDDFKFNFVEEKLRYRIKEIQERLPPYAALLNEARRETDTNIGRCLSKHEIKGNVNFAAGVPGRDLFRIPMIDPIFSDKTPLDFLIEKTRRYQNVSIIVYVDKKSEGHFSTEHRIHQISMEILTKVREDPRVQEQRREREYLIKECNSLIELIENKIVL